MHRQRSTVVKLLGMLALGISTACGLAPSDPQPHPVPRRAASLGEVIGPGAATGFNLVLITLDTVRQDRLGCYGYPHAETPNIDGFTNHGVLFSDAVTSVPITLPSHATLLTGLSPVRHGVHDNGAYHLADSHTTLAESLKEEGYSTAAFVGCFVLDARFGLDQGFDVYDFQVDQRGFKPRMPDFNERDAGSVSDAAIKWLEVQSRNAKPGPFFLWLHYFDAHFPYRSPLSRLPKFAGRPYDAEIAYVDSQIGRFFDSVDRLGLRDKTLVVLASDHGEALGDHGESTHGMLLYEATVRVPLILSAPGLMDGSHVIDDQVVGLVDLRATIEDLLGFEPSAGSDGRSLVRDSVNAERSIYMETIMPFTLAGWSPLRAIRRHSEKFIAAPQPELYDLDRDPVEANNLFAERPGAVAALEDRLAAILTTPQTTDSLRTVDDSERARLEALGYVRRDFQAQGVEPGLADPKVMMPIHRLSEKAEGLYAERQYEQAAEAAQQVVDACPDCVVGLRVLAFSHLKLGRGDEAARILREAVDRGAGVFIVRSLAQVLIMESNYAQAERVIDLYETIAPGDGRAPLLRGDVLDRQGNTEAALGYYRKAMEIDPVRTGPIAEGRIERVRNRNGAKP